MKKMFSFLKIFLGWPISILALIFIFKLLVGKTGMIIPNISQINIPILTLGLICYVFYFFLRSFLWKKTLNTKGYDFPLKEVSFLWGSSEFKRYVPGNIWSFIGRTVQFSERGVPKKTIASCLLIEVQFFLLGCLIVSLLSASFIIYNFLPTIFHNQFFVLIAFGAVILFSVLILGFKNFPFKCLNVLKHLNTNFSFYDNLSLIGLSALYMFLYGLGTYFVIASTIFLSPVYILTFIGLFVFSLMAGYLSLITPMGLGVREGIMTIGLSKFISVESAGFSSIFSRVILIISELIFLGLAFGWKNLKNEKLLKFENLIKSHIQEAVLAGLMIIYTIYFTAASFLRFDNFYTGRFDLGNMDQTVWNTINGRIFQLTDPNGTQITSRLAFHSDFILVLISPFYLLWSDPRMLLLLQTIVLSAGSIFVFLISKEILKNKNISLVFSFLYLANPALQFANLYDFHPVTLSTTFLLATFYFLLKKRYILFLIFALLAALTKEQVWAIVGFFGLYIIFKNISGKRFSTVRIMEILPGILIFIFSIFIFSFLVSKAIPEARGSRHFALSYYSEFGDSPGNIIKNIIFSPQKTFSLITQNGRLTYLYQIFSPLGYLSLLSPVFFIFMLPDLAINLLSNNPQLHQIYYQYTSTLLPFIFISVIYAVKKIKKRIPKIPYYVFSLYLILAALYAAYSFGPLPGAKNPNIDMFVKPQPYREIIDDFLMRIPKKYSIAATNNLGSHLSHRQLIFTIPVGIDKADIVAFLLNDPFAQPSLKAQKETVNQMKQDKNYIEIFKQGDFIVFEKRNLILQSPPKISKIKLSPISIPTLQHRDYIGGQISIDEKISETKLFTSYIIFYPSDGLKIYSLMNVPNTKKPQNGYPVLIINHGYINTKLYDIINSYKTITDYFSSKGYLVLKPDYRGNGNSEIDNEALMRFSYPIDVLNLISSVENIEDADKNSIFLWGHSMGAEVTLKVLEIASQDKTLNGKIKAAVLWAPVADTVRWFEKNHVLTLPEANLIPFPYEKTFEILGTPEKNPVLWNSLSPLSYLSDINIPVQINHGTDDQTVPYSWSIELYDDFLSLNKKTTLNLYPDDNHNLSNSFNEVTQNNLNFFNNYK